MTEKELEAHILDKSTRGKDDARYVLGKLMVEGSSSKVGQNENKGLNYLKEAAKAGNLGALEYKTYYDIRFDRKPNIEKITGSLKTIMEKSSNPARACNTLGEFKHAQASSQKQSPDPKHHPEGEANATEAAKHYQTSADLGDVIGNHWIGVFKHEGFGVAKNIDAAMENLMVGVNAGNGQSMY